MNNLQKKVNNLVNTMDGVTSSAANLKNGLVSFCNEQLEVNKRLVEDFSSQLKDPKAHSYGWYETAIKEAQERVTYWQKEIEHWQR